MRARALLLIGLLALLVLVTLGPGLITRHGQHIVCSAQTTGCADSTGGENPFDYHPVDGRVAGNAGDLIVLYCQREYRNINVYTIDHNVGIYLASFEVDKLQAAGAFGLTVDVAEKGVVSMAVIGANTYYVVVKGGSVREAGLDTYARLFKCDF